MRFDEKYSGNVFIGASSDLENAQAILYGIPMDWTVTFRPGSRLGPTRIRESSLVLEEYSPYLRRDLGEVSYFDAGDIPLPFGNVEKSLYNIRQFIKQVLEHRKVPFGIGGEHLVTWPIVQEMVQCYPELAIIHIDAHADLRTDYEGEIYSHATVMHKVVEMLGGINVYQFGIRSMTQDEANYIKEADIQFYPFEVLEPLKQCLPKLSGRPVYVTLDIDTLDPAAAPGTGTPEPGGVTSKEILAAIHAIASSKVQVVGVDIVEVAPVYDPSEQTAILAAKLLREMLLGFLK
jgi:agmatinase